MSSKPALSPRKAARPSASVRRLRKERRPGEIIEAALEEFALRGYAAARLEDVAERVGVTKGTIYVYFKDKEELFKAVVRSFVQPALQEVESFGASFDGSAEDLMRANFETAYRLLVSNRKANLVIHLLIAEGPQFPELVEFYHREIVQRGMNALQRMIERGIERREFRRSRLAEFPQVLFAPVMAAIVWNLTFSKRHPLDLQGYAKAHFDLLMNGLKAAKTK
jgi:AcrR family transcriptional regulator